jgi:hypothetical protein
MEHQKLWIRWRRITLLGDNGIGLLERSIATEAESQLLQPLFRVAAQALFRVAA